MTPAEVITLAGTTITEIVSATTKLITDVPFVVLPMAFVFGRKILGGAKGLLFYKKGGRR